MPVKVLLAGNQFSENGKKFVETCTDVPFFRFCGPHASPPVCVPAAMSGFVSGTHLLETENHFGHQALPHLSG